MAASKTLSQGIILAVSVHRHSRGSHLEMRAKKRIQRRVSIGLCAPWRRRCFSHLGNLCLGS